MQRAFFSGSGSRSTTMVLAILAGLLLLAPLVCSTHQNAHDQMGLSRGICASVVTLAVGTALTIPLLGLLSTLPLGAFVLAVPPLFDPITKPPQ
jgi:hypothetical protein